MKQSIFKVVLNTVSKLTWLKNTSGSKSKHMKPGKGFNKPISDHAFDFIKELDDSEFEKLISLIFKQRGYSVTPAEEDSGFEITLKMDGQTTLVQYQHWREYEVDVAVLEAFAAVMESDSVRNGIVITTGLFTQEALDFSHGKHLLLINGVDLSKMIDVLGSDEGSEQEQVIDETPEVAPLCPICNSEMIKRTARKGKNAGNIFWGCSQYPNCRGIVSG